jgi:hypothetical protein
MHKKLEAELVSLAHSILQMKNKDDVNTLHKKAREIYEKLCVLKFVDTNINNALNSPDYKEEVFDEVKNVAPEEVKEKIPTADEFVDKPVAPENFIEEVVEESVSFENTITKEDNAENPLLQTKLEEELNDAITAETATQLFENATNKEPVTKEEIEEEKRSLNDTLFKNNLQIGLNDRIAFVKHLFDGSQEDFNRVLSQLNTFKVEQEAVSFINKFVKPDYDWNDKEEYEQRLIHIIERKFS